jgi:isocitrate dehydrogenase kinase/phosphatase
MQQTCRLHNFELGLVFQCDPETKEILENLWSNLFETDAFEMEKKWIKQISDFYKYRKNVTYHINQNI